MSVHLDRIELINQFGTHSLQLSFYPKKETNFLKNYWKLHAPINQIAGNFPPQYLATATIAQPSSGSEWWLRHHLHATATWVRWVEVVPDCECSSSFKQPASHEYIPFHTIHSCIHSLIHSFNRGHRHLTADQPPGLLGKHEFIGYY